jgi:hypothetical protein
MAIALVVGAVTAAAGTPHRGTFAWLKPTSAPANWNRATTPDGAAVLAFPPIFRPVRSDPGAVSVAVGDGPRYLAYLNVTPKQGAETLAGFPAFRVNLLGSDHDAGVRQDGSAEDLRLHRSRVSVVMDDYFTRVGAAHYREIAVFVAAKHASWVVVAAALNKDFARFRPSLQGIITSFAPS